MEDTPSSATPLRQRPAQGRERPRGALPPRSRARKHDAVAFLHVSSEWDHVKFREYVISHAKRAKVAHDQATLAKLTTIDSGLLGRYFRGEVQPGEGNLEKIHKTVPGTTMLDLRILSGRARPSEYQATDQPVVPRTAHPAAERIDRLLSEGSPLSLADREQLGMVLHRILDSYERDARRRTA